MEKLTPFDRIRFVLFITVYWFAGGYVATWFTPFAFLVGRIGVIIGLVSFLIFLMYEDSDRKAPIIVGCVLWAPPPTLMFAGAVIWGTRFLELI